MLHQTLAGRTCPPRLRRGFCHSLCGSGWLWVQAVQQQVLKLSGMQIENMAYPITIEALHTVFSPYGNVQKITIFEKNGLTQVTSHLVMPLVLAKLPCLTCHGHAKVLQASNGSSVKLVNVSIMSWRSKLPHAAAVCQSN